MKKKKLFLTICILGIILALILNTKLYMEITLNSVLVWATLLAPSLFPFFFFTRLFNFLDLTQGISNIFGPFSNRIYKTSGASGYVFFISIFSGYPVGSKVASDLYEKNLLSTNEMKRTVTFTSNSGPMFIIGTVGVGMLLSKTAGLLILFSHILGALLNGLIYRNVGEKSKTPSKKITFSNFQEKKVDVLTDTMQSSINSILMVGGWVVICFVLSNILINLKVFEPISQLLQNIFHIDKSITINILSGIIEMTNGCLAISKLNLTMQLKTIICCFLITFGGISTMMQAMSFLKKGGISYKFFALQKTTHATISTVICIILTLIIKI